MIKSDIATSRHCEVSTVQSRNLTCELVTLQPLTRPFNLASSVATLQRLGLSPIRLIWERKEPGPESDSDVGWHFGISSAQRPFNIHGAEEA
jgi:hypothetical protein